MISVYFLLQVPLVLLVLLAPLDLLGPLGLQDPLDLRGLSEQDTTELIFRLLILWVRTLDIMNFTVAVKCY